VTAAAGPAAGAWEAFVDARHRQLHEEGRWRRPRAFDALGPRGMLEGRRVVAFASNDYLGLSRHPAVVDAAAEALARWGAGSGASRLVTGSRPVHHELEAALADWKGQERAVLFPTGFAANLGILATFGDRDTLILSDELNHASIIDGARLSRASVAVYRHGDVAHVEALLSKAPGRCLVVTDLVFSMDGDVAPVGELAAACARHGALLVLDEAHAVLGRGALAGHEALAGHGGRGSAGGAGLLRMGTLSKVLGSQGGFVAGPARLVELLENCARSYIFTTAPPPASVAAAMAALGIVRSPEGAALTARLASHVDRLRPGQPSPIVPVVLGSEQRALRASDALLSEGIWVPAIRPPTVPPGTARLRVTLSAAHTDAEVDRLAAALERLQRGALA